MKARDVRAASLALVLAFACSCTAGKRGADVLPEAPPVVIGTAPDTTDPFTVNGAAIVGDTLTVDVSYGGGCRHHEFTLTAGDAVLESYPVQLPIWLAHDANGDACERWVTEERQFDLSPIKTRYRNAYGQESGVIHLLWDRVPEGRLEFRF